MARWSPLLAFLVSFLWLSYGIGETGLAAVEIDRVSHILAQDEAVYSHISRQMAQSGDWMTPRFMGRLALFKPPLLYWAAGGSVRVFGDTLLALRLPSLLAGAGAAALLFHFLKGGQGVLAMLLLLSNPLWHTLSRLNLTDALLSLWIALAVAWVRLGKTLVVFVGAGGGDPDQGDCGADSSGNSGGVVGAAADGGNGRGSFFGRRRSRVGLLLSFVWFGIQWWLHPQWFWAEFVQFEILGFSLAHRRSIRGGQIWFMGSGSGAATLRCCCLGCGERLARGSSGKKDPMAALLLAWVAMVLAAVMSNQYRNIAYVMPAIPALCWLAAGYTPWKRGFWPWVGSAAVLVMLAVRLANPSQAWGIDVRPVNLPITAGLERYAALQRPNDLILVEVGDQFVAANLGIRGLRYAFVGSEEGYRRYGLDFRWLGIALSVAEYKDRGKWEVEFGPRLKQWG